ncbi:MAG: AbrB/MazE/SpoVT family DNA-binding domain-containing protein [Defluviitaleaceae bacterium]|nr:AbrB/MazE/SpoVT family DNA-binding domain-containing protein [Defluviitaleaceae bacterium]
MTIRKMDELGRVVIPKEMRTALDLCEGDSIIISLEGNRVALEKHSPTCQLCDSSDEVQQKNKAFLCKTCYIKLS